MSTNAAASIAVTGLDAVYYLAKDFKRGVAFYRDTPGPDVSTETERNVEFDLGDGNTFGVSYMPDVWYPGGGAIFAVKDLDAAVQRLKMPASSSTPTARSNRRSAASRGAKTAKATRSPFTS